MLLQLAQFVDKHQETMGLHEEHPLLQQSIEIISTQDVENGKSPFTLYKTLKRLALVQAFLSLHHVILQESHFILFKKTTKICRRLSPIAK